MLALPVSTADIGFVHSMVMMSLCWLIMTAGAFLILAVNLRFPPGCNMVSMAKATLGLPGQVLAWVTYLVLLYALLSAYISGGSDVLNGILSRFHLDMPSWVTVVMFTLLFGAIVYQGIRAVDYINRGLMFGKLGVYLLLLVLIAPHVHFPALHTGSTGAVTGSLMILITSFGFASIVPSLREYFQDDVPGLRRVILLGSLIPLFCYILWNLAIMGVLQHEGNDTLSALLHSGHATSGLNDALRSVITSPWIDGFFGFFTAICMVTAFLAVSLGLFDFLADGLKLNKKGRQGHATLALTFLPPLAIVLINPGIYLSALSYAGICCVMLLLLLPAIMAWRSRRVAGSDEVILVPGGNIVLLLVVGIGVCLLYFAASQ